MGEYHFHMMYVLLAGGGDPHFMVEMGTLPYPLCFDVNGEDGDYFQLLRDPQSGIVYVLQLICIISKYVYLLKILVN